MMYEVINFFTDLWDEGHAYNVGDEYPRAGVSFPLKRYEELEGSNNRQGKPLIRKKKGKGSAKRNMQGAE